MGRGRGKGGDGPSSAPLTVYQGVGKSLLLPSRVTASPYIHTCITQAILLRGWMNLGVVVIGLIQTTLFRPAGGRGGNSGRTD